MCNVKMTNLHHRVKEEEKKRLKFTKIEFIYETER